MKPSVLFRFDAGPEVGLGHLRRSLTLANALKRQGVSNISILTAAPSFVRPWVKRKFPIHVLKSPRPAGQVKEILQRFSASPHLLIADHYGYSGRETDTLRGGGIEVVSFDDRGEQRLSAPDGVINHNVYGKALRYPKVRASRLYLGARYTIINESIRVLRETRRSSSDPVILFCAGGGMDTKLLKLFLGSFEPVRKEYPKARALIVCGISSPSIRKKAPKGVSFVPPSGMAKAMARARMAVSASGVTAYELACAGIPAMLFSVVDNQDRIKSTLCRLECAAGLNYKQLSVSYLSKRLLKFWPDAKKRSKLRRTGMKLIDGQGSERLAAKLKKDFHL